MASDHGSRLIHGPIEPIVIRLAEVVARSFNVAVSQVVVEEPSDLNYGHIAVPLRQLLGKEARQTGGGSADIQKHVSLIQPEIANWEEAASVSEVNGFLNLRLKPGVIARLVTEAVFSNPDYGSLTIHRGKRAMVEYVSPNTNKPLHLGHARNSALGIAMYQLLRAVGFEVVRTCVLNDRGPHISKSMIAYQKWGDNKTPASEGVKGDHFVGDWYIRFESDLEEERQQYAAKQGVDLEALRELKQELKQLKANDPEVETKITDLKARLEAKGIAVDQTTPAALKVKDRIRKYLKHLQGVIDEFEDDFLEHSNLQAEVDEMLRKWEAGDPEVRELWRTMNEWVEAGFDETYRQLGAKFDRVWKESDIYQIGKGLVEEGEAKGFFSREPNGAVIYHYHDPDRNREVKVPLLKRDGTSLYHTQDLGLAKLKANEFEPDLSIYVVADEQNAHFRILFEILEKFGFEWAQAGQLFHLSYGMVDLPSGKMKSRTGQVVDVDDLIAELTKMAKDEIEKRHGSEQGPLAGGELDKRAHAVALSALSFYLLKFPAKTRIRFDPQASISFEGETGPYLQYVVARIKGILRKAGLTESSEPDRTSVGQLTESEETQLLLRLAEFPGTIALSAERYDPAVLAMLLRDIAQLFNVWYQKYPVLRAEPHIKQARLCLIRCLLQVMIKGLDLLGIKSLDRM